MGREVLASTSKAKHIISHLWAKEIRKKKLKKKKKEKEPTVD